MGDLPHFELLADFEAEYPDFADDLDDELVYEVEHKSSAAEDIHDTCQGKQRRITDFFAK